MSPTLSPGPPGVAPARLIAFPHNFQMEEALSERVLLSSMQISYKIFQRNAVPSIVSQGRAAGGLRELDLADRHGDQLALSVNISQTPYSDSGSSHSFPHRFLAFVTPSPLQIFHSFAAAGRSQRHSRRAPIHRAR